MRNKVPVLFLIYKNPRITKKVFDEISKYKPERLYIAADGPKKSSEVRECNSVRKITEKVSWKCSIERLYRDRNLGCKVAVSEAISWFFSYEESGIILEYDCLPNESFFYFCEKMLKKYENDSRVMHISGSNFQNNNIGNGSYYFSSIAGVWGWATWRNSWGLYDANVENADCFIKSKDFKKRLPNFFARKYWSKKFLQVLDGKNKSSWAIPWAYSIVKNKGVCVNSNFNLVSNIGFSSSATHAFNKKSFLSCRPLEKIEDINYPKKIELSPSADIIFSKQLYKEEESFFILVKRYLKKFLYKVFPEKVVDLLVEFKRKNRTG